MEEMVVENVLHMEEPGGRDNKIVLYKADRWGKKGCSSPLPPPEFDGGVEERLLMAALAYLLMKGVGGDGACMERAVDCEI